MEENYELNYEAVYEAMRNAIDDLDLQTEYFKLLPQITSKETNEKLNLIGAHIAEMDMRDQLLIMRVLNAQQNLAKVLCKKYDFKNIGEER